MSSDSNVIKDGGEVKLSSNDDVVGPDRIELLNGGWVKLVFKKQYQKEYYPPHKVDFIASHTREEETVDWWDDE